MLPHNDIDAILAGAQKAVNDLSSQVAVMAEPSQRITQAAADKLNLRTDRPPAFASPTVSRILKLKVPIVVQLARRSMQLSEILRLAPGTILEFDRPVDSPLDLLAGNHPIGSGKAVKVNEHFGLKVNRIGDLAERIHSFAG